jgi:hypothetical protein
MRTVRNITVAVEPELYRRDRAAASPRTPVNPTKPISLQQLAGKESVPVQNKYFRIITLKYIIQNALRAIP